MHKCQKTSSRCVIKLIYGPGWTLYCVQLLVWNMGRAGERTCVRNQMKFWYISKRDQSRTAYTSLCSCCSLSLGLDQYLVVSDSSLLCEVDLREKCCCRCRWVNPRHNLHLVSSWMSTTIAALFATETWKLFFWKKLRKNRGRGERAVRSNLHSLCNWAVA